MEHLFVGIDVAKDHLDVHVRPTGEAFRIAHDEPGLAALLARLRALNPTLIALEATGGYEIPLAAGLAGAGLPVAVVNPRRFEISPAQRAAWPRPMRSTRGSSRSLLKRSVPPSAPCRMRRAKLSVSSWPVVASSSTCSAPN